MASVAFRHVRAASETGGAHMDAQTVIAVCDLLLVVVALIRLLGRDDE